MSDRPPQHDLSRACQRLARALAIVGRLAARDQARERAAWHAGHATGYRRGQQERLVRQWKAPCPHCKRLVTWDRDWLNILGALAFDAAHRRELWAAHAAEVHGHPYPMEDLSC